MRSTGRPIAVAAAVSYILAMVSRALGGVLAALALVSLSVYGCGPTVPKHNGYRSSKPWKKAKRVKFDEENEISIDGSVSYIKKRRARWYVLELPGDGELAAKMEVQPAELGAAGAEMALGFEVLDAGYNVVLRRYPDPKDTSAKSSKRKKKRAKSADDDDDDDDDDDEWTGDDDDDDEAEGELEWEQTLLELHAGRYFVHVYALARLDAADFSLRLKYTPGTAKRLSTFPADVPFYDPLPVVPAFDDAPSVDCSVCDCRRDKECKSGCGKCERRTSHHRTKVKCSSCSCSSRSCARSCKQKCGGSSSTSAVGSVKARVVGIIASGTGTKITLNRGSSQGVQVGWRGRIVNSSGKSIEKGSFTVTKVTGRSSRGKVGASQDSVRAAGRAVLRAP